MTLGDLLEWAAVLCLVLAFFLWFGLPAALAAAFAGLFYLAQGFGEVPLRRKKPQS